MLLTLEDRLDLQQLAHRYGDIIDDRDWPALAEIFIEEAVFEVVDLVTMTGLREIQRYMDEEGRHPLAHLITNVHVAEDAAGVQLYSRGIFPIDTPEGAGHRVFYGSYYDRVVRTDAGWRIAHRVFSAKRRTPPG
jgi:3-phenylpropionate/cinnamic acid dioxygenase small subunit